MARPKKRTRIAPKKKQPAKMHIREIEESKDGYQWKTFMVQGWREDGKWQRRKFKDRKDAERFLSMKTVEILNDAKLHNVTTRLSPEEVEGAEIAIKRLGGRYSLDQAVTYFLAHYAEPEEKVEIAKAIQQFLTAKGGEGIRPRTLAALHSSLGAELPGEKRTSGFKPWAELRGLRFVHEVTTEDAERFLKSLRSRDGSGKASPKTWNNYRADLHSFFGWCADLRKRWIASNPVAPIKKFKVGRGVPETITLADQARELMRYVAGYTGSPNNPKPAGHLVRYFALALFGGIRTGGGDSEMIRLAEHKDRDKLIDLARGVIRIPPEVSKTHELRTITIRPNLRKWLLSAPPEIYPANHDREIKEIRAKFTLGRDVLRHSFFSHHVAAFGSVGEAALEGGNTEAIVKRHYLNAANREEGKAFWGIKPKAGGENILRIA